MSKHGAYLLVKMVFILLFVIKALVFHYYTSKYSIVFAKKQPLVSFIFLKHQLVHI